MHMPCAYTPGPYPFLALELPGRPACDQPPPPPRRPPGSFMQCEALASRAKTALEIASRLWTEAVSPLHAKMKALATSLEDAPGLNSVAEQLLVLLAVGVPSPTMHTFLSSELREGELTRIVKALTVTAAALTQLCVTQVPSRPGHAIARGHIMRRP